VEAEALVARFDCTSLVALRALATGDPTLTIEIERGTEALAATNYYAAVTDAQKKGVD
jgi:hypothetical protein